MTKINRMVMSGFKSFATKTEIVFGDNYNCILGPNGSGKSNVMDALCFVLGKGSSRELRAEKAANLIYNGGKAQTPAKEGLVAIYFDNKAKEFPTEDEEVKISRIVKENGQSVYKINDKVRTRQEILELLSLAKIDPDGYNIILQGDVTHFVDMSLDERRRILEDISGIGIYEEKKEKALSELGRVDQRMNDVEIVLAERKTYLGNLKEERDQAMRFRDLEKKAKDAKGSLARLHIKKKEQELEKLSKGVNDAKKRLDEIKSETEQSRQDIAKKKIEIMEINSEIEEKGDKTKVELHKQIESLKVEIGTGKNKFSSIGQETKKIDSRREELKRALADVDSKIESANSNNQQMQKSRQNIIAELESIQKKIDQFKKKNNMDSLGDVDKELEDIDKDADIKGNEIAQLREKQQELLRSKDRLEQQIKTVEERIAKVDEVKKEYKKELENLKDMKNEFKKLTLDLNKKLNEDSNLAAQLGNAKSRSFKLEQEFSTLQAKRLEQQAAAQAGTAVQKILENKSRFPGVYGTVADLGKAKGQYGTALEVAAGPRLKSIIVEDDAVAARCISYLKENRLGVAPFIPLNKIKDTEFNENAKKFLKHKGVHGMAIELVEFDPKFQKAFRYVFGSTIIVDSVEDARKIGIGNVRMATIDGDLMEISGAMIGGFRQKTKSAFQDKDSDNKLERVEKELEEEKRLISLLEGKRQKIDDEITELRTKKANLEGEIIKLEKSLHLESSDLDMSMQAKSEFEKELKSVDKQLDALMENISSSNSQLAQLKIRKQQLRDRIASLRNPTIIAELTTFEQKKEEFRQELNKLSIEIDGQEKQISTIFAPEKERISRMIREHDEEEKNLKSQAKELLAIIKQQEKQLSENEKKEKEFYEKFKILFSKRNKLQEDIQKIELKMIKLEEEGRKNEAKVNEVNIDSARINAEIAGLVEEVRQYGDFEEVQKGLEQLRSMIYDAEKELREFGNVNMKALEIYEQVENEYNDLIMKKDTLRKEKDDVMMLMNEIEGKKKELFMNTFNIMNENFKNIFSQLLTKGEATLELENPESPFEGGVSIKVRITGKKYLDIRSLSGGEKTMTALALIFAIQENDPASFYVLDEVDAALDKKNAETLARWIRKYADKAQYIMISHNDGVISEADNLYGVSMNEFGMSKVVSLKV